MKKKSNLSFTYLAKDKKKNPHWGKKIKNFGWIQECHFLSWAPTFLCGYDPTWSCFLVINCDLIPFNSLYTGSCCWLNFSIMVLTFNYNTLQFYRHTTNVLVFKEWVPGSSFHCLGLMIDYFRIKLINIH